MVYQLMANITMGNYFPALSTFTAAMGYEKGNSRAIFHPRNCEVVPVAYSIQKAPQLFCKRLQKYMDK